MTSRTGAQIALVQPPEAPDAFSPLTLLLAKNSKKGEPTRHASGLLSEEKRRPGREPF